MLATKTLVGLACLIANKGPLDTSAIEEQILPEDRIVIEELIAGGVCLPDELEKVLVDTAIKIKEGKINNLSDGSMPTDGCF